MDFRVRRSKVEHQFHVIINSFGSWGEICESANRACLKPCSRQAIGVMKIHGPHDWPHEPELDDDRFNESFEMNNKKYRIFEGEKTFTLEQNGKTKVFPLRKIYLWNQTGNRRTCCLAWDAGRPIDCHINNFTALSVVGVLQYAFLPLAL